MHSGWIISKEKLLVVPMLLRIAFILGWFWYFSMACLIVIASLSQEVLVRSSIPWFWMIFPKYLLKISTNSLSSETTLLFSTKVVLSFVKVLSLKEGFNFSKKSYFRWCILHWGYCKTSFWFFLIVSHKNLSVFYMPI